MDTARSPRTLDVTAGPQPAEGVGVRGAGGLSRGPYPKKLRAEASLLRAKGFTYAQIGASIGVKRRTVARWCTGLAFAPCRRPSQAKAVRIRRPDAVVEAARRMRAEGATLDAIALALKLPPSTVISWVTPTVKHLVRNCTSSREDRRCDGGQP